MHISSIDHVRRLVDKYLDSHRLTHVIDIGSYDVNGSYKHLFSQPLWSYTGVDLTPGPNVDVVLSSPYRLPIHSHSVDVVVSGQAFEHIEFFWLTWLEICRVVKPGGLVFLVAPSRGPEHRYPQDCWRFYADGFAALAKYGDLELLEATTDWQPHPAEDSGAWGDTVGAFRQRSFSWPVRLRRMLMQHLRRRLLPGYR